MALAVEMLTRNKAQGHNEEVAHTDVDGGRGQNGANVGQNGANDGAGHGVAQDRAQQVEGQGLGAVGGIQVPNGWTYEQYAAEAGRVRAHELALARLRAGNRYGDDDGRFNVFNASKSVPRFNEHDVEGSLECFEKFAQTSGWPREHWSGILVPNLAGKALKAFTRMDAGEASERR